MKPQLHRQPVRPRAIWSALLVLGVAWLISGCATQREFRPAPFIVTPEQAAQLPPDVARWHDRLQREGERNAVLNLTELATAGIQAGSELPPELRQRVIDTALDEATIRIDAIYADTPEARQARSLWGEERRKDFKGEPYERVYPFLLRGLRYLQAGEWANARASFITAILQDAITEEGDYRTDWATLEYLVAYCHIQLGNQRRAEEAYQRAKELGVTAPMPDPDDNFLAVAMAGQAPRKLQGGAYDQILVFAPGKRRTRSVQLAAPWQQSPASRPPDASDDVYFQATTRGGRAIDEINERKAHIKANTQAAGEIGMLSGAVLLHSRNRDTQLVGAGFLAAGLLTAIISSTMKAEADVRALQSVPSRLAIWTGKLPAGPQDLTFRYQLEDGPPGTLQKTVLIDPDHDHNLLLVRLP